MAKHGKKRGGLQRKVSSVFKQVSVPQQEGDQQRPTKPTQDGSYDAPSRPMPTDSLVSKSSLMKKVCRSKSAPTLSSSRRTIRTPCKPSPWGLLITSSSRSASPDWPTQLTASSSAVCRRLLQWPPPIRGSTQSHTHRHAPRCRSRCESLGRRRLSGSRRSAGLRRSATTHGWL